MFDFVCYIYPLRSTLPSVFMLGKQNAVLGVVSDDVYFPLLFLPLEQYSFVILFVVFMLGKRNIVSGCGLCRCFLFLIDLSLEQYSSVILCIVFMLGE
jgi:hypothetical protein